MEINSNTLNEITKLFTNCLNADNQIRENAEKQLKTIENQSNFLICLLQTIASCQNPSVVLMAATYFKNVSIRRFGEDMTVAVGNEEKLLIYTEIVSLMCNQPDLIRSTLAEAISIVVECDYPQSWNIVFPKLKENLDLSNLNKLLGIFETTHAICKQFRDVTLNTENADKLKLALDHIAETLVRSYAAITNQILPAAPTPQVIAQIYKLITLLTKVFYDLNYLTIPESFEDNIIQWMGLFAVYLKIDPTKDANCNLLIEVQTNVIESIILYSEKYGEEFEPFYQQFCEMVWTLCTELNQNEIYDTLIISTIKFLGSVITKSTYNTIFTSVLPNLLSNIAYPNFELREIDLENFEDNAIEYIRRDAEGSDSFTRRRSARELVDNATKFFETEVFTHAMEYLTGMRNSYLQDPAQNWKKKDIYINLVIALCAKGYSYTLGVLNCSQSFNLLEFFQTDILPELTNPNLTNLPVIKADCMKFCMIFRNQFPKDIMLQLMQIVVPFFQTNILVLHMYAALIIEKFICVRDVENHKSHPRIVQTDIQPFVNNLIVPLFNIIQNPDYPDNEFVMKAIMRVVAVAMMDVQASVNIILEKLTGVLARICKNPTNPSFNHYLFETIAVLIKALCPHNTGMISGFEGVLFPPFTQILQENISEFTPYVFQLMAQLLECRDDVSAAYQSLYPPLMMPAAWDDKGNNPPMVRLITAYFTVDPTFVVNSGNLEATLGVFQRLFSVRSKQVYAFSLIDCIITHTPYELLKPYFQELLKILLFKAQSQKEINFRISVISTVCLAIGLYTAPIVVQTIDGIQPNLFIMVLSQMFSKCINEFLNSTDIRCLIVGMCTLFSTVPAVHSECLGITNSLVELLSKPSGADSSFSIDYAEDVEYNANYSKLVYAASVKTKVFPTLPQTNQILSQYLVTMIGENKIPKTPEIEEYVRLNPY